MRRLVIPALLLAACSAPQEPPTGAIRELTEPATDRLEPVVREQLAEALALVHQRTAAGADRESLGAAYGQLGRLYHAYSMFEAAVPAYTNAEILRPDEHAWPYYLGRVHQSLHDPEEALVALERARALSPGDAPTLVALARVHRELRRFDEAAELLVRALERNPVSGDALLLMATLAVDRGDPRAAIERYERLLRAQPEATRLYRPLALAYRDVGQIEKAQELLSRAGTAAVRIDDPLMAELVDLAAGARRNLDEGVAAFQRGDFPAAAAAFRAAVETQPDNAAAHLNLGSALLKLGRANEASEEFRTVIGLDPDHTLAHFNLAAILAWSGDVDGAAAHYEEALRIDPAFRNAHSGLAELLRRTRRCERALPHYEEWIRLDPGSGSARAAHALCLAELGRHEEALRLLDEALQLLPADPAVTRARDRLLAAGPTAP